MSFHRDKYQTFATLLEQFRSEIVTKQLDAPGMQHYLVSLKQFFQLQILPLTEETSREQSYRTEMSKQLRLLEIDVMFYQGARQAATASERRNTISDRLSTLTEYCQAILQLQEP
jgi:hypothetical protein